MAVRTRPLLILTVTGGVVLLAGPVAFLWSSKAAEPERAETRRLPRPPSAAQPVPEPPPAPKSRPPPARQQVELMVRSEPPAMLAIYAGGKLYASHHGQVTAHVPPGPIEIEVTGSGEHSFVKREALVLDPLPRKQEHTVVVRQGILLISSFPASRVAVDGVFQGDAPLRMRAFEGTRVIDFECDRTIPECASGRKATQKVVVRPGEELKITQRWP